MKLYKFFTLYLILIIFQKLNALILPDDNTLKKQIGQMLIIGFDSEYVDKNSQIIKDINQYNLAGVILFDKDYKDRNKVKNISSPEQLNNLTSSLKSLSNNSILISIDQEGGKVARLKTTNGFDNTLSAKTISSLDTQEASKIYQSMAKTLKNNGINCNFAPVVDLAINPQNKVIYQLERTYGINPQEVIKYSKIFIEALHNKNILSVIKHFPGHGSSLEDSHYGFVDISNTWNEIELIPYKELIKSNLIEMIMTAHVFNKYLDSKYPATLSYNINTKLLREEMGYKGVVISDDLQMKAIMEHYSLEDIVTLAINSGVDILLFGNQLSHQNTDEIINVILDQVKQDKIKYARIVESNQRVKKLFKNIGD
ncbi:MAG: glycoside hydrolase family 3 N-terminal domain-containing protein [Arcobacteraceae bacterium]|nr:glycoside hydrolase family 3 N-terminal domain-containing protein [Arcobacteraceae bacterium]